MKLGNFGAGKTQLSLQLFLNELFEERMKWLAKNRIARTWKEYEVKSYWRKR